MEQTLFSQYESSTTFVTSPAVNIAVFEMFEVQSSENSNLIFAFIMPLVSISFSVTVASAFPIIIVVKGIASFSLISQA